MTTQETTGTGWKIPQEVFERLAAEMAGIAFDTSTNERHRIGAARVLVQMHGQNSPAPQSVAVTVSPNNTAEMVKAMMKEPDYLKFLYAQNGYDAK
ncbi:MAG: hypothetical protein ACK5UC_06430 [Planctomycetaceae bacterium]|jgi:hypothetical protein